MSIDNTTPKVGQLLDGTEGRDAIHFALAPVIAGERLIPGTHVRVDANGHARCGIKPIGIVDPFLTVHEVNPGERFWLFLYPNTITGLRHVWTHPAFTVKVPNE